MSTFQRETKTLFRTKQWFGHYFGKKKKQLTPEILAFFYLMQVMFLAELHKIEVNA